ncbi:hypothetical protein SAMN05892883_2115 [Jatrophihabitans sp. GAS493]|uniref:hypothetical protein n=1 Tax=Jatrophihabitans sp. GAS493 TaxID=1907575 RepID=UPI000BBF555F|nr:hypothetical protein [Jatrophihabitans sp. GAS493]SOD72775.1 hypothetical protein SAMN05892883_2115 [Jatrophihabitans sp. GAS493]
MRAQILAALSDVLLGEVSGIKVIESAKPEELASCVASMPLVLKPEAVVSVLQKFGSGQISADDAQRWASLVRWGFIPGRPGSESTGPVDIDWELRYEDEIGEAVGRLDELGDLIDGTIDQDEVRYLINSLTRSDRDSADRL